MNTESTDLRQPPVPDSLWRATAIEFPHQPNIQGSHETTVVVIGAGFTGCSAALHLAQSGIDVILLDAGQPGIGASGRNGGQVNPGIKRTVEEVQEIWGKEQGQELYKTIGSAPDFVFKLIEEHNIDCHPVRSGIIQPAYSKKSLTYLKGYGEYHASTGAPVEFLSKQETSDLIGSDFYLGGFIDRRAGSVQPLSYCRGLASAGLKAGAIIYGDSAVTSIDISAHDKIVKTAHSTIKSQHILVCTNGYTNLIPDDPLIKKLSKTVVPLYSYKVATSPLSQQLQDQIIPEQQVIADTRRLLTYFRKDHMGRLVMGGAGGPYEAANNKAYDPIITRIHKLYPQIKKVNIEFRWCGKVCLTMDGLPHVHELAPGVLTGLGYNGRGVAMASLMGKWLAARITGEQLDGMTIPITQQKPLPFHSMRNPFVKALHYVKDVQDRMER